MDDFIDLFMTAFMGGVTGSVVLMFGMYHYFKHLYKYYAEGRKQLQEAIDMKRLQQDVQALKIQVVALQVANSEVVDD
jgi:isochorismate hydrolase